MEGRIEGNVATAPAAAAVGNGARHIELPGGQWRLWRSACLRGAGFPADLVLRIAAPRSAAAADEYVAARRERERRYDEVLERLRVTSAEDPEARVRLRAARRRLRRGVFEPGTLTEVEQARLAEAMAAEEAARERYLAVYAEDELAVGEALSEIAALPRLREAALWQTGEALAHAAAALRREGKKARQAAEFIALLVQRYAVKNDTCGFFGPSGWLELDGAPDFARLEPASELTAERTVYFEDWTIDVLTQVFDRDPAVRPWAAPRPRTDVWIGPDGPYAPGAGKIELPERDWAVLRACDGATAARTLAARLAARGIDGLASEADVYDCLRRLVEQRLLVWKFEVPPQLHPEDDLALRIQGIGDEPARERCAAALRTLVEARARVAQAQGDPERLKPALEDFNATFERLTGEPSVRNQGLMYAARGVLYHDSRRAGSLKLGRAFLERLGPALSIVLDGGRWLVSEITDTFHATLRACLADLRRQLGRDEVDGHAFLEHAKSDPWMRRQGGPALEALRARYQAAWQEVLGAPASGDEHRVFHDVEAAAARARRLFASRGAAWSHSRQLSPDIMVAAAGPEALERGEFECVLGELHSGNTLKIAALAAQHHDLDWMLAALEDDSQGEVVALRQSPRRGWLARANQILVLPTFWRYEYGEDLGSLPSGRSLPAGGLLAVDDGVCVKLRARDGAVEFDALELFHDWLCPEINDIFGALVPDELHTPRVTLGGLTVARERWSLRRADMPFLAESDAAPRYAAVRAWARDLGMPRWVFYKAPAEPKPCYLDFDSPAYVNVFARIARRLADDAVMRMSEMTPRVDEAWLADAHGVRYTCELRFVSQPGHSRASA